MFEIALCVAVVVIMARIASAEGFSSVVWGAVAVLILTGCVFLVPLPFARVLLGAVLIFVALMVAKARRGH